MLITRKTKIPTHWVFYAQVPFVMAIAGNFLANAPFLFAMKKFIDNPAAIMVLINLEVFVTILGGPLVNWLSDRIWTRYGRRKPLIVIADIGKLIILPLIPFAPDLWTLIGLKWAYGIAADLGSPNQPLTMEVVPTRQRGRGAGFFQMQIQLVNIIFWGTVIGRFDDVYFMGPLNSLMNLSGEHLMFIGGSLLFLAIVFYTFFGIKEIKPPVRKTLTDDRRGNEWFLMTFLRSFFKDILSRSLLPLYMLLFVGQMAHVGLGLLGPLLYTDEWGYSMQEMGTNVAVGAAISIPLAIAAGYFADATSKMKVYVWALIGGLAIKIIWVIFVSAKPGNRPELYEIIIFGEMGHIFSLIASVVSFPLILEFVERNRLGTASAGMGLFNQLLKLGISTFVGFWIVWWSLAFFPQAGSDVRVVFNDQVSPDAVRAAVETDPAEEGLAGLHYRLMFRPGTERETSRLVQIRADDPVSGKLQEEKKELETLVSKWNTAAVSPLTSDEERAELKQKIADRRSRIREIETDLTDRARRFSEKLTASLGDRLYEDGRQILEARILGNQLVLALEMVEPVADVLRPEPPRTGMFAWLINSIDPPDDPHEALERGLQATEYRLVPVEGDENGNYDPSLAVQVLEEANGIRLRAEWDERYTLMNRAFTEADRDPAPAHGKADIILGIFRGLLGQAPDAFAFTVFTVTPGEPDTIVIHFTTAQPIDDAQRLDLENALSDARELATANIEGDGATWQATLTLPELLPEAKPLEPGGIRDRLAELTGGDQRQMRNLRFIYDRVVEAAAAQPVFLHVARPVIDQTYATARYEYFYSSYTLMIVTDFFGLAVIAIIVILEKRGLVHRYGVEEDAHR